MPGILGYSNSPGLLGNMGQALQAYATRTEPGGYMSDQPTSEEYEEYERAKAQGFQGTFDEWRQQKRASGVMGAMQTQYMNSRPIQVFRPGIVNPPYGMGR